MRPILIVTLVLAAVSLQIDDAAALITSSRYHTLDEVNQRIFAIQDSFPDWVKVYQIGHSQAELLPIYAVKVTENVQDETEIKPAVTIFGQVHAEEVLGVEYCMRLLEKLTSNTGNAPDWRENIVTWVMPTNNPEGLRVVHEVDYTYRKNKRDNIGDGLFRYSVGWGWDTSGVDLNRNFPFFWTEGDNILQPGKNEPYDYYRGPAPLSEPEAQCMDSLVNAIRPIYSVVLHSSRTGNFAEKVIFPWDFGIETAPKKAPDIDMLGEIATRVASRMLAYSGTKSYEPSVMLTPGGNSDAYFYWKYGTIAYRIEIGEKAEGMQPEEPGVERVLELCIADGMEYFLNSAAGISSDRHGNIIQSRLRLRTVSEANPDEGVQANIILYKRSTPLVPFRTTHPTTGEHYWVLPGGYQDTILVWKYGYKTRKAGISIGDSRPRHPLLLEMVPLPEYDVTIQAVMTDGAPIESPVTLVVDHLTAPSLLDYARWERETDPVELPFWVSPDTSWEVDMSAGSAALSLAQGSYRFTLLGGRRFVPRQVELEIDSSRTWTIALAEASVLLDQNFDGYDVTYTSDNVMNKLGSDSLARWELTPYVYHTPPRSLTDTRRSNTSLFENSWAAPYDVLDTHLDLSTSETASLVYWINQALEPGFDSMWVEVSTGGAAGTLPSDWDWTPILPAHQKLSDLPLELPPLAWDRGALALQKYAPWERVVVPLNAWKGKPKVHIRFHLRSDGSITQDGVYIDDVLVLASGDAPPQVTGELLLPGTLKLGSPHPNPFNSAFQVNVTLPEAGRLELALYDLQGRLAAVGYQGDMPSGTHRLSIDASSLPAGLYILRGSTPHSAALCKVTLVK